MAGAALAEKELDDAKQMLTKAISEYLEENGLD
jgi:hypothetical protein